MSDLLGELQEEQPGQVGDAGIGVAQAQCHLADLPLDLHHVVQDQVAEHHQRVLPHRYRLVTQPGTRRMREVKKKKNSEPKRAKRLATITTRRKIVQLVGMWPNDVTQLPHTARGKLKPLHSGDAIQPHSTCFCLYKFLYCHNSTHHGVNECTTLFKARPKLNISKQISSVTCPTRKPWLV